MPRNRVRIDGADLYAEYGLVLSDDYEIGVPEHKSQTVELLGCDGALDLSEAFGDVLYSNRTVTLPMFVPAESSQTAYERLKSRIASRFNGKRVELELAVDPGYTYAGRLSSVSCERRGRAPCVTLVLDAEPYKSLGRVVFRFNAAGGVTVSLDNGRARTQPRVQVARRALVVYEGRQWELEPGAWTIEDLWFHEGRNLLTIDTATDYRNARWEDYAGKRWADVKSMTWAEAMAADAPIKGFRTWGDFAGTQWWEVKGRTWLEGASAPSQAQADPDDYMAYVYYDWRDL